MDKKYKYCNYKATVIAINFDNGCHSRKSKNGGALVLACL